MPKGGNAGTKKIQGDAEDRSRGTPGIEHEVEETSSLPHSRIPIIQVQLRIDQGQTGHNPDGHLQQSSLRPGPPAGLRRAVPATLLLIPLPPPPLRIYNLDYNLSRCPNPRVQSRRRNSPTSPPRPSSSTQVPSCWRRERTRAVRASSSLLGAYRRTTRMGRRAPRSDSDHPICIIIKRTYQIVCIKCAYSSNNLDKQNGICVKNV